MQIAPKPLAESDEIFLRADIALAPAQWRELQLSPRTGWVVGVVAARRPPAAAQAATAPSSGAASSAAAPRIDVLVKVDLAAQGVRVARLSVDAARESEVCIRAAPPPSAALAHDLVTLEPSDAPADEDTVARMLNEHCPRGCIGTAGQLYERMHAAALGSSRPPTR